MKRVIKHQKKMKNTMYIVFGAFALALFAITRINPSYANDWLMIDNALDAIVLYWEVETSTEDEVEDEVQGEEKDILVLDNEWDEDSQEIFDNETVEKLEIMPSDEDKTWEDEENVDAEIIKQKNEILWDDDVDEKETQWISTENIDWRSINSTDSGLLLPELNKIETTDFETLSDTTTIKYHPNWWAFSWMWINESLEKIYNYTWENIYINDIQIPNRTVNNWDNCKWWMFAWWFTHPWVNNDRWNEWLWIIDENTESQTVYAKWLKFNDLSFNFSWNNIKIMDRNLWAEQTANWDWSYGYWPFDDVKSLWYYYKWWNNHWFTNRSPVIINDSINISDYWINTWYYSSTFQESLDNMNIWWWLSESDFDKQWPCPLWYHIPSITEWKKFNELFYENIDCSSYQDKMTCYSKMLKLPYSTQLRKNNDWEYTDEFRSASHDTYYIGNVDKYDSYSIFPSYVPTNEIWWFRKENIWPIASNHFSLYLYPIRCFENTEPTRVVTIDYSDWNILQYWLHWRAEKIPYEMIPTIKKDWYKFNWRYNTENWEKISSSTIIESDISIKAMWECIKWYYESEDWYSCLPYTWTIIANWWIWEDEIFEVKVPVNKYRREWYKFVWWNTSENWDWIDYVAWTEIESNWIKLYAKWEKNPRYNLNI